MTTAVFMAATILGLAACGSSSGGASSAKPSDVAAVAKQMGSGGVGLSSSDANCVGRKAAPKLSAAGLKEAHKSAESSDLSKLSKADQEAVFDAVSDCTTITRLATVMVKAVKSEVTGMTASQATCVTKAVEKAYPDPGDLMRDAANSNSSKLEKAMSSCRVSGS